MGNPLPESFVGLFTTLCTGWILKKRTIKLVLFTKMSTIENWKNKSVYIPPLTPDQPPL